MDSALRPLNFTKNVARIKRSVIRERIVTHPRISLRFIRATVGCAVRTPQKSYS
jgi:hypothetical protein